MERSTDPFWIRSIISEELKAGHEYVGSGFLTLLPRRATLTSRQYLPCAQSGWTLSRAHEALPRPAGPLSIQNQHSVPFLVPGMSHVPRRFEFSITGRTPPAPPATPHLAVEV